MSNQLTFKGKTFKVGDTVRVYFKVFKEEKEEKKSKKEIEKKSGEKTQIFEGIVLSIRGRGKNKTFTVRKVAKGGIGIERIFPVFLPLIEKVIVRKKGRVRRAKLYYLRKRTGKAAIKVKERK